MSLGICTEITDLGLSSRKRDDEKNQHRVDGRSGALFYFVPNLRGSA
jgi:hypothetical protein